MFGAVHASLTYASVRIIFFVLFIVAFALFFHRVLLKKKLFPRVLGVFFAAALIACLAVLPVENLFFRFGSLQEAYTYMLPKVEVLTRVESGDRAAVMFMDKSVMFFYKDEGGWQTRLPLARSDFRRGAVGGMLVSTRDLGGGAGFVCVDFVKYKAPRYNKGRILPKTLTDSAGSEFTVFTRTLHPGQDYYGAEYIYCAFTNAAGPGYRLVVDGEERSVEPVSEETAYIMLIPPRS